MCIEHPDRAAVAGREVGVAHRHRDRAVLTLPKVPAAIAPQWEAWLCTSTL